MAICTCPDDQTQGQADADDNADQHPELCISVFFFSMSARFYFVVFLGLFYPVFGRAPSTTTDPVVFSLFSCQLRYATQICIPTALMIYQPGCCVIAFLGSVKLK